MSNRSVNNLQTPQAARPGMSPFSSFRAVAAAKLKSTVQNVQKSVATVQAARATSPNPPESSFIKQTWTQWNKDRAQRRADEYKGTEKITLFPGWAVRRTLASSRSKQTGLDEFNIDVFVSGYAYSMRPPEFATRSQRAFMKIARGFASLPRLPDPISDNADSVPDIKLSPSTEDLLRLASLPPRPEEMTDEMEKKMLEEAARPPSPLEPPRPGFLAGQDHGLPLESVKGPTASSLPSETTQRQAVYSHPNSSSSSIASSASTASVASAASAAPSLSFASISPAELIRLHANFDARLQPFWGSMVTNRIIRLKLYTTAHTASEENGPVPDYHNGPVATAEVVLGPEGYFNHLFHIPFEDLCTHPGALHIAYGDPSNEPFLIAVAELLPNKAVTQPPPTSPSSTNFNLRSQSNPRSSTSHARTPSASLSHAPAQPSRLTQPQPTPVVQIPISLTSARLRVISDIDDTVKVSNILHGVRTVFRNVFVRHLDELAVPGMPEWYKAMERRGVRFHYVSNSPFELLPVLSDFFQVNGLPLGSLKLKFYGGRSLFKGLWEPAGERKRAGVIEILDQFPDSQFLLVGDSGEQDLELYTALARDFAREGRNQIAGIFIRDVSSLQFGPVRQDSGLTSSLNSRPPSPTLETPRPPFASYEHRKSSSISSDWPSSTPALKQRPMPSSSSSSYFTSNLTASPAHSIIESPESNTPPTNDATPLPSATARSGQSTISSMLPARAPPIPPRSTSVSTPIARSPALTPTPTTSSSSSSSSYSNVLTPTPPSRSPMPFRQGSVDSTNSSIMTDPAISAAIAAAAASSNIPQTSAGREKKRQELEARIARCRADVPEGVVFRIFREPEECFEDVEGVLERMGMGSGRLVGRR